MHFIQHSAGLFLATHQRKNRRKKNESAISKTVAGSEKSKDWIYFSFAVCLLNFHKNNRIYAKMRDRNWRKNTPNISSSGEKKEWKNNQFSRILKSSIRNVKTEKWSSIGIESETEHFLRCFFYASSSCLVYIHIVRPVSLVEFFCCVWAIMCTFYVQKQAV